MKYQFTGDVTTTYAEYLDADAGHTLVAEPGGVYTIRQADGVTRPGEDGRPQPVRLPVPPDGRWRKAPAKTEKKEEVG